MKFGKMQNDANEKSEDKNINKTHNTYKEITTTLKKRTIKSELLFIMLSISIVLTAGIMICVITILSKNYDSEINNKNETTTNLISKNVSSFMDTAYKVTEELSYNSDIRSKASDNKGSILKDSVGRNPYFELLYIQDNTGMQIGRSSGENGDRSDRWWFTKAKSDLAPFTSLSTYFAILSF